MASSNLIETPIRREVERLFGEISANRGDLCTNPVTGEPFDRSWIEHEKTSGLS